ncbi:MAG: serpin family protein, partial [Candidatus Eremiobacteraeota bacterium]|nr:serpin family protein [Candidatus Eremiobacteraeota bacterium]
KAKWQDPFKKSATHETPFHEGSATPNVSMMSRTGSIEYAQQDGWQVARLPYCCSNRFAMYVLLPKDGTNVAEGLQHLGSAGFDSAISGLQAQELLFEMPRYTATYKATLNDALKSLGMAVAFGDGADFGNLVAPPAKAAISQVNHRTFVRVDEAGTEAAAATSVGISLMAMRAPPPTSMIVDRPFVVAIRDDQTKQLLFLGTIVKPEQ